MEINQASSLIIISLAVFIVPILSRYLKIPSIVGEILFGIAIGKSGLGLIMSYQDLRLTLSIWKSKGESRWFSLYLFFSAQFFWLICFPHLWDSVFI